ncbi:MAG: 50S ribosomal protein L15 [Legionellales bacterium RIFCSPHIGHO2_12_FULL_35_11]|nr:MAG: 50S ribosomal protein L15 [Legionellales bacterium RIFCSPHIGHO2_12_FULL_35_11]
MRLNTLSPDEGSRKNRKRVGRGIGSGLGKTCGRGHKGQKSRAGGFTKINFEGGQMPLQRRLPKFGFKSRISPSVDELTLSEIGMISADVIDINAIREAGLISASITRVKVILSGELTKPVKLKGIGVTIGARKVIEELGGSIEK